MCTQDGRVGACNIPLSAVHSQWRIDTTSFTGLDNLINTEEDGFVGHPANVMLLDPGIQAHKGQTVGIKEGNRVALQNGILKL